MEFESFGARFINASCVFFYVNMYLDRNLCYLFVQLDTTRQRKRVRCLHLLCGSQWRKKNELHRWVCHYFQSWCRFNSLYHEQTNVRYVRNILSIWYFSKKKEISDGRNSFLYKYTGLGKNLIERNCPNIVSRLETFMHLWKI